MNYSGRHAVVLGLGLTGYSLARHLAARGAFVRVADTRATPPFAAKLAAVLPDYPKAQALKRVGNNRQCPRVQTWHSARNQGHATDGRSIAPGVTA